MSWERYKLILQKKDREGDLKAFSVKNNQVSYVLSAFQESSYAKSFPLFPTLIRNRPKDRCMVSHRKKAVGKVLCRACRRLKKEEN
jgi:hypothetical protein